MGDWVHAAGHVYHRLLLKPMSHIPEIGDTVIREEEFDSNCQSPDLRLFDVFLYDKIFGQVSAAV